MGFKARGAIAMLDASHRRQEERLTEGRGAADALTSNRGGSAELAMVTEVLGFLRKQARRHIADEEESVFPRLRARPGGPGVRGLIAALEVQHREHAAMLDTLERCLGELTAAHRSQRSRPSRSPSPSRSIARRLAADFATMEAHYRAHIALEDGKLLPAMRRGLSAADLTVITDEMHARRGPGRRRSGRRGQGPGDRGRGRGQGGGGRGRGQGLNRRG